jgi:hypothetical protein
VADTCTVGGTVWCLLLGSLTLALGCHPPRDAEPPAAGPSCRDVARQAERVIAAAPESVREGATHFYAEVIDLCQAPGLAQRARACLATAADLAAARTCPSLPATADDSVSENGADPDGDTDAPPCNDVVAHAMHVLERSPDAPVSATDRAEEEDLFARDCAAATPAARHCAIAAATLDALDECLAPRAPIDAPNAP